MTVLIQLLAKFNINPDDIGRLELATEHPVTHKPIHASLMRVLKPAKNFDVDGSAVFAGTYGCVQALFNVVAWISGDRWDGRYGVVVGVDGCCGAAILVAPNTPIIIERVVARVSDDVQGIEERAYANALKACYDQLLQKRRVTNLRQLADFYCFQHSRQDNAHNAFLELVMSDLRREPDQHGAIGKAAQGKDPNCHELVARYSNEIWESRALVSCTLADQIQEDIGNCSLLFSLGSLIKGTQLSGRRVLLFGYGEGFQSAMFTIYFRSDCQTLLDKIQAGLDFTKPRTQAKTPDDLPNNTYYIISEDSVGNRFYALKHEKSNVSPKL